MELQIFLSTIIALIVLLTGIGFIVNMLLNPIKEDLSRFEAELKRAQEDISLIKAAILKG